jgi:tRNA(Ile)-lysidine synthase
MHRFLRELITEWRRLKLPVKDAAIVVAVSGGADSAGLLLALHQLKEKKKCDLKFIVAHFNHDLRGDDSDKDEKFVKKLAKKLELEFETGRWKKTKTKTAENLEQSARVARYEFLEGIAEKHQAMAVITGHTINDQAETFLLRLVRGSGLDGLGGMKPVRELTEGKSVLLARPMLRWAKREDTEGFCREFNIKYRNDKMNLDETFSRVKVRKKLLPLLQEMNPAIIEGLARTAMVVGTEIQEMDRAAEAHLAAVANLNTGALDVKGLLALAEPVRMRVLRQWLLRQRGDLRRLDMEHFAAVERLILKGTGGKTVELPGGERVTLLKGALTFTKT